MTKKILTVAVFSVVMGVTAMVAQPPQGKGPGGGGAKGAFKGGKGKGAPAAPKLFTDSAEIQQLIARSKEQYATSKNALITQPILSLAPYRANLEYRSAVANASIHDTEAEMFYVIQGGGTLVTGGTMVGDTTPNGPNHSGPSLEGGTEQKVAAGDFIMVPEKTGHWFNKINGVLVMMSIHLPQE